MTAKISGIEEPINAAERMISLNAGENDARVAPYESRKFAARLQAARVSGYPILLRA